MTARNDITGDAITNSKGNREKFSKGMDAIDWSKKSDFQKEYEKKQTEKKEKK